MKVSLLFFVVAEVVQEGGEDGTPPLMHLTVFPVSTLYYVHVACRPQKKIGQEHSAPMQGQCSIDVNHVLQMMGCTELYLTRVCCLLK